MKLEVIGQSTSSEAVFSPDGQCVAFVAQRPFLSTRAYIQQEYLYGADRADVWVASVTSGVAVNITKGEADGSGYWNPVWSPDGERLAMLSTKGGDNVRLWVWEKTTGRLTKLSERGARYNYFGPTFVWIDNKRLVSFLLPKDEQTVEMKLGWQAARTALREWPKAWAGREATASVLDSGVPADINSHRKLQLTILNISGREQPVAPVTDWLFLPVPLQVPSDGLHIAFMKRIALLAPDPARPLRYRSFRIGSATSRYQISIADASGRIVMAAAKGVRFVALDSFRWGPDGHHFAFIGVKDGDGEDTLHVFLGDVSGSIQVAPLPDCDPRSLVWASGGRLLISAECNVSRSESAANMRKDWWLMVPGAAPRNLTEKLSMSPDALAADPTREFFLGIANGQMWRMNIASGEWTNLTEAFELKVAGIAWPTNGWNDSLRNDTTPCVLLSVQHGLVIDYYRMDISSGNITPIARPFESAKLIGYRQQIDVAMFAAKERTGTYLTEVRGQRRQTMVKTNTFLQNIGEGERRMIAYRSFDGQELKGWLILPPKYQSGKKYPLLTWVYPGTIFADKPVPAELNEASYYNLQLFAARGYAVLLPSMPLTPQGEASDPYMGLMDGVLPAVEKTIELGFADPQRLAVMGVSYGGYATLGLVTQTARFKAAIAAAGYCDLIAKYGTYKAAWRYEPDALDVLENSILDQAFIEDGQDRMGSPAWKDLGRYLRNSPIFYVDRVKTPLMIVHGDMDFHPIQQAEEFFSTLYRQGKRAQFIRYWGEGHGLLSPANIRDFWNRTYAWLDEFCDISRDADANLVFDGDHVQSRNGASPLKPEDFARFDEMELRSHPWVRGPGSGKP